MTEFMGGLENLQSHQAGGTLTAGDAVKFDSNGDVVRVDTAGEAFFGIAMYDATDGEDVAIAATGARVRDANVADAVTANDLLTAEGTNNGRLKAATTTGDSTGGIATNDADSNNEGNILVAGPSGEIN